MKNIASDRVYARALYLSLVKRGICTSCGHEPARDGVKTCQSCSDKCVKVHAIRHKKLNKISAFLGKCQVCRDRDAMPKRKWCGTCSEWHSERKAAMIAKRVAEGRCTRCGKAREGEGRMTCESCREKERVRSLARRQKFQVAA